MIKNIKKLKKMSREQKRVSKDQNMNLFIYLFIYFILFWKNIGSYQNLAKLTINVVAHGTEVAEATVGHYGGCRHGCSTNRRSPRQFG
jgi:uncharacterized membrane protein